MRDESRPNSSFLLHPSSFFRADTRIRDRGVALADPVEGVAGERAEGLAAAAGPEDLSVGDSFSIAQAEGQAAVAVGAVAGRAMDPAGLAPVRAVDSHSGPI